MGIVNTNVEDFDVLCTEGSVAGTDDDLAVYGTAFHESEEEILEKYLNRPEHLFLRDEQLQSCGNYLLFDGRDPDAVRIVTSPGFCSGYLYSSQDGVRASTLLSNVIPRWKEDSGAINSRYLKLFLNNQRPFQNTPFDGVDQLRPAAVYKIKSGSLVEASSYLRSRTNEQPSVEQGMRDCARSLAGNTVSVMFSGGLDSLSWYLVLASELGESNVKLVTVDWRPGSEGQGPYLAQPVAENLGIELDIVSFDDGWLTEKENVVDHITNWMKRDFTISRNPNHALVDYDEIGDVVINLTNNESLITLQMNHLYRKKFVNRQNDLTRNLNMLGFLLFKQYAHNVPYTAQYMRSLVFRLGYLGLLWPLAKVVNSIHPSKVPLEIADTELEEIDVSADGVLNSILAKTAPNVQSQHQSLVEEEREKLVKFVDEIDTHYLARLLYFYGHMSYPSKTLETLPHLGRGTRTYLPTTWGPLLPLLFSDLSFNDVVNPRQQLLDIVEFETGHSFTDLRPLSTELRTEDRKSTGEYRKEVYSSVINKHSHLLSPERSSVLEYTEEELTDWYREELQTIEPVADNGRGSFWSVLKTSRMLNLELLLRSAN